MPPLYSFMCNFGHYRYNLVLWRKVDERNNEAPRCPRCHRKMRRVPSVASFNATKLKADRESNR